MSVSSVTQLCPTLYQASLEFSRQEYWSGSIMALECHFLLQGIFLTQGSNLDLLHLFIFKKIYFWNSLAVQWLRFFDLTAEDPGLIPGRGSKIPKALQSNQKYFLKYINKIHK